MEKKLKVIVISINGKDRWLVRSYEYGKENGVHEKTTPESLIRAICSWYANGTKFVVEDMATGEIEVFAKVFVNDEARGYSEVIKLNHMEAMYKLFTLLELEF